MRIEVDFLIIGAGIMGLTIARELKSRRPDKRIAVIEKEADTALHASGRNSGVLHAGFYYAADSLKAKFTRDGNKAMREYCSSKGIPVNGCGKLVIAGNDEELEALGELKKRADINGVELIWVDEKEASAIDPQAKIYKKSLYSPNTASIDPVAVCQSLKKDLLDLGVEFYFDTRYISSRAGEIATNRHVFACGYLINAAGLYADRIAHDFGFGKAYTILPFKGLYLKYRKGEAGILTHLYPVPDLRNPFLGVHFTKAVDGSVKIGPTATPALWRENYGGLQNFNLREFISIAFDMARLFARNSFHFRSLAWEEVKKYRKRHIVELAEKLAENPGHWKAENWKWTRPGIRAQLLNKSTLELVQDFVIEGDASSMHVLNAVSPAFTCSMPFAAHVVDAVLKNCEIPGKE